MSARSLIIPVPGGQIARPRKRLALILRYRQVYFFTPSSNSALNINPLNSTFLLNPQSLCRTPAHFAVCNQAVAVQQFLDLSDTCALFDIRQRNQNRPRNLTNLILIGIANIQQYKILRTAVD